MSSKAERHRRRGGSCCSTISKFCSSSRRRRASPRRRVSCTCRAPGCRKNRRHREAARHPRSSIGPPRVSRLRRRENWPKFAQKHGRNGTGHGRANRRHRRTFPSQHHRENELCRRGGLLPRLVALYMRQSPEARCTWTPDTSEARQKAREWRGSTSPFSRTSPPSRAS